MAELNELFTTTNIAVVGVATLAITVTTIALNKLFKIPTKWTAFVCALIISFIVVFIADENAWYDWVLGFFNACLLFCSALGLNEIGVRAFQGGGRGLDETKGFLKSWL